MPKKGTHREIVIKGNYGYGWEVVFYAENFANAQRLLREYNDNEPQYAHKIGIVYE